MNVLVGIGLQGYFASRVFEKEFWLIISGVQFLLFET